MRYLKIGDAARQLNVSPTHLRDLEAAREIPTPRRTPTGFRLYEPQDVRSIEQAIRRRHSDR